MFLWWTTATAWWFTDFIFFSTALIWCLSDFVRIFAECIQMYLIINFLLILLLELIAHGHNFVILFRPTQLRQILHTAYTILELSDREGLLQYLSFLLLDYCIGPALDQCYYCAISPFLSLEAFFDMRAAFTYVVFRFRTWVIYYINFLKHPYLAIGNKYIYQ